MAEAESIGGASRFSRDLRAALPGPRPAARWARRAGCIFAFSEGVGLARPGPSPATGHRGKPRRRARLTVPQQLEPIWRDIRDELRRQAPDFKFHIWLEPL